MSDIENDLRSLSDDVKADAGRLVAIEAEKVDLPAESGRTIALSREAEKVSRDLATKTAAERELVARLAQES
jgi:hypothetical protein